VFVLLITIIGLLYVGSSILLRSWVANSKPALLAAGIVGFALTGLTFAYSMRYQGLAIANILWIGLVAVLLTVVARWIFQEGLTSRQLAGIAVIICGVILLNK
jgi:multidrug transporter EmrE-like cation transporter